MQKLLLQAALRAQYPSAPEIVFNLEVRASGDQVALLVQVAQVTPKPLKRMLSSRPPSRKQTADQEEHVRRNALSSTSAEGAPAPVEGKVPQQTMRRAQTAPYPLSDLDTEQIGLDVRPPHLGGASAAKATGEDEASPIG